MRIGILTQPPHSNYGCILQAYALQTALQQLGHDVWVFNADLGPQKYSHWQIIRFFIHRVISSIEHFRIYPYYNLKKMNRVTSELFERKTQFTSRFVNSHINQCLYRNLAKDIRQEDFDAIVVGSDQVWRPKYCGFYDILDAYLKFASKWNIRRIGYAISFGSYKWEYTEQQTNQCKELANQFDALSFRESSGVTNCKRHFGIEAIHVVDPTLLHASDFYRNLFAQVEKREELFCYILDKKPDIEIAIDKITKELSFGINNFTAPERNEVLLPVEDWLQSIDRSKYVITDSFHGCVFSIIFNKPFWVVGNKDRGQARFDSLLETFQLQDRLVTPEELLTIDIARPVNWDNVNSILKKERERALNYLKHSTE